MSNSFNIPEFLLGDLGKVLSKLCALPLETLYERLSRPQKLIEGRTQNVIEFEKTIAQEVAKKVAGNDDTMLQAIEVFGKDLLAKQENKNHIGFETVKLLESQGDQGNAEDREEINDDWINHFANYAEKISEKEVQSLWAKILAGEIRKPGTYSLLTLRHMAEMDKPLAEKFAKYIDHNFGRAVILKAKNEDGYINHDLLELQNAGYLSGVTGGLMKTIKLAPDGFTRWDYEEWYMVVKPKGNKTELIMPSIALTRPAMELIGVLKRKNGIEMAQHLAQYCAGDVEFIQVYDRNTESPLERVDL